MNNELYVKLLELAHDPFVDQHEFRSQLYDIINASFATHKLINKPVGDE